MWLRLVAITILMGIALFLGAGTLNYWQAWAFLGVGVLWNVPLTQFMIKDPTLLESRSRYGPAAEKRTAQKVILLCTALPAIATFIVPALDRRYRWSNVPVWLSVAGDFLILAGIWLVFRAFKVNSYAFATVEVTAGQKVVSTGPYAIIRHPMYTCAAMYMIGTSLALGSYWGLLAALLGILGFVWRLLDEEKFLAQDLAGYAEYCAKVRWRLVPGVF